jgi:flagellar biosynthesis/type III secretory pathway protein FliH
MKEYQARLDALNKSWARALESFQAERRQLWSDAHNDVVRLSLTIAERIIKRALDLDPSIAASQAQAALDAARGPRVGEAAREPQRIRS